KTATHAQVAATRMPLNMSLDSFQAWRCTYDGPARSCSSTSSSSGKDCCHSQVGSSQKPVSTWLNRLPLRGFTSRYLPLLSRRRSRTFCSWSSTIQYSKMPNRSYWLRFGILEYWIVDD